MKKNVFITLCISVIQICFGQKSSSITGKVIDQDLNTLLGVEIRIGDSIIGKTDLNGEFKIELDNKYRKITFMYVGMEKTPITIGAHCSKLEVVMLYSGGDCFATPKKIEKIRKKKFKKIQSIYKKAYSEGTFELEKPCGEIEFVPQTFDKKSSP